MRRTLLWVVALTLVGVPVFAQRQQPVNNNRTAEPTVRPRTAQPQPKPAPKAPEKREEARPASQGVPTERDIVRALDRVNKYMPDKTIRADFRDGRVLFTPADLGGLSDEQLVAGFILGYVETDRQKTDAGLESADGKLRKYPVYVRKEGRNWEVWFTQQGQAVAKSPRVDGNLDSVHPPVFQNSKRSIWYWRVRFDF